MLATLLLLLLLLLLPPPLPPRILTGWPGWKASPLPEPKTAKGEKDEANDEDRRTILQPVPLRRGWIIWMAKAALLPFLAAKPPIFLCINY